MSNDILFSELIELQMKYKKILLKVENDIFGSNSTAIVDEINVFWKAHKNIICLILQNLQKDYQSYVFTGAVVLDISSYEHYPFVLAGKYHFWDDPLCSYAIINENKTPNPNFDKKIHDQIAVTIKENIRVLDNADNNIFILPLRLLAENDKDDIKKVVIKLFLGFFKDNISNIEEYYKKYNSIDDVITGLSDFATENIRFSVNDDIHYNLKKRFEMYKGNNEFPLSLAARDSEIFFICIFSNFMQALDILLTCMEYKLIPYLVSKCTLHYVMLLAISVFDDDKEVKDMVFKSFITNIIYNNFNTDEVKKIPFEKYLEFIKKYDFESKLYFDLKSANISFSDGNFLKTVEIVNDNINNFLLQIRAH